MGPRSSQGLNAGDPCQFLIVLLLLDPKGTKNADVLLRRKTSVDQQQECSLNIGMLQATMWADGTWSVKRNLR